MAELARYDLKTAYIDFSAHALTDKNLTQEDLVNAKQ